LTCFFDTLERMQGTQGVADHMALAPELLSRDAQAFATSLWPVLLPSVRSSADLSEWALLLFLHRSKAGGLCPGFGWAEMGLETLISPDWIHQTYPFADLEFQVTPLQMAFLAGDARWATQLLTMGIKADASDAPASSAPRWGLELVTDALLWCQTIKPGATRTGLEEQVSAYIEQHWGMKDPKAIQKFESVVVEITYNPEKTQEWLAMRSFFRQERIEKALGVAQVFPSKPKPRF